MVGLGVVVAPRHSAVLIAVLIAVQWRPSTTKLVGNLTLGLGFFGAELWVDGIWAAGPQLPPTAQRLFRVITFTVAFLTSGAAAWMFAVLGDALEPYVTVPLGFLTAVAVSTQPPGLLQLDMQKRSDPIPPPTRTPPTVV